MSFLTNLFEFDPMAVLADSEINNQENWVATVRTKFEGEDFNKDCRSWIEKFGLASKTNWIVQASYPNMTRFLYRKAMVCQHSSSQKKRHKSARDATKRDANCKASINFLIKKTNRNTTRKDQYLKNGLNAVIKILFQHSHRVYVSQAYQLLRLHPDTREQYHTYFADGKNAKVAHVFHELWLMNEAGERNVAAILADVQINPRFRQVDGIYEKWKASPDETDVPADDNLTAFAAKRLLLVELGVELVGNGNDIVCVITPLMRRAHGLEQAKEVCFVDSTHFPVKLARPSVSRKATAAAKGRPVVGTRSKSAVVTFVYAATKLGPVPLACILHSDLSLEDVTAAMSALKEGAGPTGFGGQGWPNVFMTADVASVRAALALAFPKALAQLSPARLCQAHWRWLWDIRHGVAREEVAHLMERYRDMIYAPTIQAAELRYTEMMEDPATAGYSNLRRNMKALWQRRKEWCRCFQEQARGSDTNAFVEASIRAFKDIVLQRCSEFDTAALLDLVVYVVETFHTNRLLDLATGRPQRPPPIYFRFLQRARETQVRKTACGAFESPCTMIPTSSVLAYPALGLCECSRAGALCVHLAAAAPALAVPSPPPPAAEERRACAALALGTLDDPLTLKPEPDGDALPVLQRDVETPPFPVEVDFEVPATRSSERLAALGGGANRGGGLGGGNEVPDVDADASESDAESEGAERPGHEAACRRFSRETERILTMLRSNPELIGSISAAAKRAAAVMTPQQLAAFLSDVAGIAR